METPAVCAHCGQPYDANAPGNTTRALDELINNLKNIDVEQYLNTAREYLQDGGSKAKDFAKENPGKVAAGVAVLAVGAGLLISALNRD